MRKKAVSCFWHKIRCTVWLQRDIIQHNKARARCKKSICVNNCNVNWTIWLYTREGGSKNRLTVDSSISAGRMGYVSYCQPSLSAPAVLESNLRIAIDQGLASPRPWPRSNRRKWYNYCALTPNGTVMKVSDWRMIMLCEVWWWSRQQLSSGDDGSLTQKGLANCGKTIWSWWKQEETPAPNAWALTRVSHYISIRVLLLQASTYPSASST